MENFDFGKAINIFLVAFVIFLVVMIAFVARLVSTFMVKNKNTNLTASYATTQVPPAGTPLEIAHSTTIDLARIGENYLHTDGFVKEQTYEVLMTMAQARKQSLDELFESDPAGILSVLFPEDTRALLPPEAQTFIEAQVITEGRFSVTQIPNITEKRYSIIARSGEEFTLYFPEGIPQTPPNSGVRIRGVRLDNKILVQSIEEISL